MSAQPESKLSRQIRNTIRAGGGYCVKFHGGPMTENGTPDLLACIPVVPCGQHNRENTIGLFVGIETKMPGKQDNVSDVQKLRHTQIRKTGGVVIVATSVAQVVAELNALGWVRPPVDIPDPPSMAF